VPGGVVGPAHPGRVDHGVRVGVIGSSSAGRELSTMINAGWRAAVDLDSRCRG
jgi:hypothetical protein